jgi:hypothetical protein
MSNEIVFIHSKTYQNSINDAYFKCYTQHILHDILHDTLNYHFYFGRKINLKIINVGHTNIPIKVEITWI